MFDLMAENLVPIAAAVPLIPPSRNAEQTSFSTVWRWITQGVRSPSGDTVRLEALRLGGRWVTSREAIQRFAEALTPRLDGTPAPSPRSPTRRERATARAQERLATAGI
jgi:hypothetical protein